MIKLLTPSEAIIKVKGFLARIERLETKEYSDTPRGRGVRTNDLNKNAHDCKFIKLWVSIAYYSSNSDVYLSVISEFDKKYSTAISFRDEHFDKKYQDEILSKKTTKDVL